ncbi:hypothetical protein [Frankia sp. Cj3]|uniref:hypothetical protein n=2 Tax=unclassified Frankia TaxID=2632575 RepID=UPI001EF6A5EF|nr:hypothetical protein [Frankia sp. Cj3]
MIGTEPDCPGGYATVAGWINELYNDEPGRSLWTVLDDPLRLALAQGWVWGVNGRQADDDLAEDLAAYDSDNKQFDEMLAAFVDHWRHVYRGLRKGVGLLRWTMLVGANMELVVLTSSKYIGAQGSRKIPGHSFVTHLDGDDWLIAATARRLPVPGWPPSEETIPGLEIDG